VHNAGPSNAAGVGLSDPLPTGTTFVSLSSPGGWSCTPPAVGANGTVSCSIASLPLGDAVFTLTVKVGVGVANGTVLTNTATVSSPTAPGDASGSADTTVSSLGNYFSVTPCRAVNTRTGAPLQNGVPRTFGLHGLCGIPATAKLVVLNITVVLPTGSGDLTLYPSDAAPPAFSTMPFNAGITRALFAIVPLSNDAAGEVTVQPTVAGSGSVHLLFDVLGYFE
jgi:hypothetical protein